MFSYNEYMQKRTQVQRNISFIPGPEGPPGAQGPQGPTGPQGPIIYTVIPPMSSINYYTMPITEVDTTDTQMIIPNEQLIPFTTKGLVTGTDVRSVSPFIFLIKDAGYYQVFYQVSITGFGKTVLQINNVEYAPSKVGTDMLENTGFLTCSTIIQTTSPNSTISLKNVSGDLLYLNVLDTDLLMTNLTITKIFV